MIKLLALLLIMVILFGLEATRSLFFGTLGFVFWTIIILLVVGVFIDAFADNRTPEQKKADKQKEKEATDYKSLKKALLLWLRIILALLALGGILLGILVLTSK